MKAAERKFMQALFLAVLIGVVLVAVALSLRRSSSAGSRGGFKDWERRALQLAKQTQDDAPNASQVHLICGHILNDHKLHTEAIREYERAARLDPRCLAAYASLAATYESLGDIAMARKNWEAAGGTNFVEIDRYLQKWDEFARGTPDPTYRLGDYTHDFESRLTAALRLRDPRAPSRFVFSALVQVGGFIPARGEVGESFQAMVGDSCPVYHSKENKEEYFAGDLYFWWLEHGTNYVKMPLMEQWLSSDFAKTVALPMYKSACSKRD